MIAALHHPSQDLCFIGGNTRRRGHISTCGSGGRRCSAAGSGAFGNGSGAIHRKLAAGNRASTTDIEYESLSKSARFVLEVELVWVNGECEAVANVKDIRSGEIPASVRQKVESLNSSSEIDQVSRALVQRLMQYKVA